MKSNASIQNFYDDFASRLLIDFYQGNARVVSALNFACGQLMRHGRRRVLDLGFGLGWSSFEFSRCLPDSKITALDLSPRLVELAKAMFGAADNLSYACEDLTDGNWSGRHESRYDSCVMLDVYEHIPTGERRYFHQALSSVLSDDAVVILSCPTPLHQEFLRNNKPEGLQPVDEDVTFDDLVILAQDIGGTLGHLEHKSIWASNDYFHAVINRKISGSLPHSGTVAKIMERNAKDEFLDKAAPVVGERVIREVKSSIPSPSRRLLRRLYQLSRRG